MEPDPIVTIFCDSCDIIEDYPASFTNSANREALFERFHGPPLDEAPVHEGITAAASLQLMAKKVAIISIDMCRSLTSASSELMAQVMSSPPLPPLPTSPEELEKENSLIENPLVYSRIDPMMQ